MTFVEIFLVAVALAIDAFTVAIAVGLHLTRKGGIGKRHYFRLGFHFGLFQALMPVIGWLAGTTIHEYIKNFDHWLAMGLLTYIGIKMIRDAGRDDDQKAADPTRGASLILLSVATSIDALAMGLSLAFLNIGIAYPAIVIGIVAAVFTVVGMSLGRAVGRRWRRGIGCVAGLVLIGIGIKVVLEDLMIK